MQGVSQVGHLRWIQIQWAFREHSSLKGSSNKPSAPSCALPQQLPKWQGHFQEEDYLPVHLSNCGNNIRGVGSVNPLPGLPLSWHASGMPISPFALSANCPLSWEFGLDNGGETSLLYSMRTTQVMLLESPSYCHCVTSCHQLTADSRPISFRQEQMRQKIELKLIHAIMTYRSVRRPFQTEVCWLCYLLPWQYLCLMCTGGNVFFSII